ncbi:hypothetical protein E3P99_01292 [Wallemia hederae]|uniref:F-box domain-containing protein n=1 Tax=Wallemia hederae TaxID=1540922 RepID=A0A4T0FR02_9BASI|nr:hypothetical protein E3P99_01292 [Wallemia hederae]
MPPKKAAKSASRTKSTSGNGKGRGRKKQWSIEGFNYLALPSEIKLMIMGYLDQRDIFALSGTCSQLVAFDAARRYEHVVVKPRFKLRRLKCLIEKEDAAAVLAFLQNVTATPYKASLMRSLAISVYTDYGQFITNDEERLDQVEYITTELQNLPNLTKLTYIQSEKHQLSTEFQWRHEGITTLTIGMLRVYFMEYEGEWPEYLIRGCPNLTHLTIHVFEFPSKTTFSAWLTKFLRDKLGSWLEDHGDVQVDLVGVTTAAGRYFGQFVDIDKDIETKAKNIDKRSFLWQSQRGIFHPNGTQSWYNHITPKYDPPVNKLKRDPDLEDASFKDDDIEESETREYANIFFSSSRQEHYYGGSRRRYGGYGGYGRYGRYY